MAHSVHQHGPYSINTNLRMSECLSRRSISAGVISALNNAGGLVLLFTVGHIDKSWDSLIMVATVAVGALIIFGVKEEYRRRVLDTRASGGPINAE
mmetsp:Transcript_17930/g.42687  ORF Transcript_17930/g.42687 Transcript_17930/m.42687 type:complete len:96 (-) Transcript_17930:698-985(-)